MKGKLIITFLILFLFSHEVQASWRKDSCHYKVEGTVLDADTKDPLPFVHVEIKELGQSVLTDLNGHFLFTDLCQPEHDVIFSCIGYCDTTCHEHHKHGHFSKIYLNTTITSLAPVFIPITQNSRSQGHSIAKEELDQTALEKEHFNSLADAVTSINGVNMVSSGTNVQIPAIHGLYGNRVLIINNGLKHGYQNWGSEHAPEIDLTEIKKISVVKGASGVKYGPEGLGGAIIIEGAPLPLKEKLSSSIRSGYQTNGREVQTSAEINRGYDHFSYHLGLNYDISGDKHAPDYSLTNTGRKEQNINAGLRFRKKNFDFKSYYSFIDQNLGMLQSSVAHSGGLFAQSIEASSPLIIDDFSYDINQPNQLTQHHIARFKADWWYSPESKFSLLIGHQLNNRQEFDVRRNANLPIIDLSLATNNIDLEWKHPELHHFFGQIGVQYLNANNDNNPGTATSPFIPNYNTNRVSAYIIENKELYHGHLEFGLRIDGEINHVRGRLSNQQTFEDQFFLSNLTGSIGYLTSLNKYTRIRSNIGTAWRTPNMAELYSFGQHSFMAQYGLLRYDLENQKLSTNSIKTFNESNIEVERGVKWVSELIKEKKNQISQITVYGQLIDNYIYDRPVAVINSVRGPLPVFIVDQTTALFIGTDLTHNHRFNKKVSVDFFASFLWTSVINSQNNLLQQAPANTSFKINYKGKTNNKQIKTSWYLKPSYTFRQFQAPEAIDLDELITGEYTLDITSSTFDFKNAPNGYFLLDAGWNFDYHSFSGSLSMTNILNTTYRDYLNHMRYFADDLGLNVIARIKYTF